MEDLDAQLDELHSVATAAAEEGGGSPRTLSHLVDIGHSADGPATLDLAKLLKSRLLVQAGSGGGKSWLLRRLLEQTHGRVRQIVFDPEGELVTLADKFDYTVCAPDSEEAPLTPGGGAAAARLIYKSGRSTILALSEFELDEMQEFVADFCRELLRMPQEQWHHLLLVIDEAQLVAPEREKAVSKKPLIDIARRGRKRGICPVCATQRLSELSKGVAGQLENLLIGLTTLDLDIARASEVLGIRYADARGRLPLLGGGRFLSYGPALGYSLTEVQVGPVQTKHAVLGDFSGVAHQASMSGAQLAQELKAFSAAKAKEAEAAARSAALAPVPPPVRPAAGQRSAQAAARDATARRQLGQAPKGWPFCNGAKMP